jgi:hypothetical protein
MRATVVALALLLAFGIGLAGFPATNPDGQQGQTRLVKLYYGLPGSNDYVSSEAPANVPTDAWQFLSEMPGRMMDNAAATDGNHVYAAAGYGTANVLYRHAVGSATWETRAPCPLDLCTGGAAIIGDTFFYCGGYMQAMTLPADTLYKYSISGDNWTSAPGPYTGTAYNWSPTVVACAGKLYYISGCNQPGATAPTQQVWQYTPGAGWAQVGSLNQGRVFANVAAYHDTIWLAGGNAEGAALTHTEFYDPVADAWVVDNTAFPQLPEGRWGNASGVVGDMMFVATGVNPAGALSDTTFVFNFPSRTWSVQTGMVLKVYRTTGCGTADNKAIVYGGSTGGFTPSDTCQFTSFAPPPAVDVGMEGIVAPGSAVPPESTVTPTAMIKNFGASPVSNIPVSCSIDSSGTQVYSASATYTGPLAPGATAQVPFSPDWTIGPEGAVYSVQMWTSLTGDSNRANDTLTRTTRATNQFIALWLYSDYGAPDTTLGVRLLALGDSLVYRDVQTSTPALSELLPYPAVGVHSNYPYADPTGLGDVLATYVDSGGGVVLGNFSFVSGWEMAGRIMTGDYATISVGGNTHAASPLGWFNPAHPIMTGVTTVQDQFMASGTFVSTAESVARWTDGRPYVAVSANGKVVGCNQYPGIYGYPERQGDWALVIHNALRFAAGMGVGTAEFDPLRPALSLRLDAAPNPARRRVVVNYAVAGGSSVNIGLYDLGGRLVKTLFTGTARTGVSSAVWDMTDDEGVPIAAGVYICKLVSGEKTEARKVVVQ